MTHKNTFPLVDESPENKNDKYAQAQGFLQKQENSMLIFNSE